MPAETGYQRQVGTSAPQAAVLSDARDYGAGVGEAIARGGQQLHQQRIAQFRADRQEAADSEAADVARRAAEARVAMDAFVRTSRTGPVPGAKGHAEAVTKALGEQRTALLDGIVEDRVRQAAGVQWDDYAARVTSSEEAYELGRGIDLDIANLKRTGELADNRIVSSGGDNAVYQEELVQGTASILGLPNVTPEDKEKLLRAHEAGRTLTWLQARSEADPASVKLELAAGLYDELLTPEQIKALDRGAELEIKAAAVEAAAAQQQERVAARNDLELIEARIEAGDLPATKDIETVIARARAAGVPEAELVRLTTKADDATILRAYGAANDPTGAISATTVAAIDEKIRAGTATPEEYRLRDKLAGYADTRAADAGKALKDMAAQGPAGELQALGQISQMASRNQRFAAGQELGGNMGYIALLPSAASRELAVNGKGVLAARPKDFGERDDVDQRFEATVGPTAKTLGPAYGQMKMLSWQIYAGLRSQAGATGWDKKTFDLAVKVAFGATKRADGVLQGGLATVRGRPVMLPDDRTADEFDRMVSRIPADKFAQALYADGTPATKADVLARFRPEWFEQDATGGNWYRLIGPDGKPLREKSGAVFPIRIPPRSVR